MFDLTKESILAKTPINEYNAGQEYFKYGRIKSVQFNQEKRAFTSTVLGTKLYTQQLKFDHSGRLTEVECTCPVGNDGWGCCKHMVAVLLLIAEKDKQGFFRDLRFRKAARDIFSLFTGNQGALKSAVSIEPIFELTKSKAFGASPMRLLRLRIGENQLYFVKDIKRLLYYMENNLELKFGKKFTYAPSRHEFKGKALELIELIKEIYETDKLVTEYNQGIKSTGIFPDGRVCMTDSYLKRFLQIYEDTPFNAVILDKKIESVKIKKEDIPVTLLLSNEGTDLVLNIDFEGSLLPLTEDGEYFYAGGEIYRISKQQSEYLKPFYMAMMYQKTRKLRFIEEDKQRFVSEILPFAEKAGKLVISEEVNSTIEKLPLEAEIYLDRENSEIIAEVRYIYGDHIINPFLPYNKAANPSGKLLIREVKTEDAILDILATANFRVNEGKIHLSGEENIYDFVFRLVPLLQEYSTVFYSESLKT